MIEVTHRQFNETTHRDEFIKLERTFKTYAEAVRAFGGQQDWYDKKCHRFFVEGERRGNLYLMKKV